jgi:hypothetical protein
MEWLTCFTKRNDDRASNDACRDYTGSHYDNASGDNIADDCSRDDDARRDYTRIDDNYLR